jgi:hypothetical protein
VVAAGAEGVDRERQIHHTTEPSSVTVRLFTTTYSAMLKQIASKDELPERRELDESLKSLTGGKETLAYEIWTRNGEDKDSE